MQSSPGLQGSLFACVPDDPVGCICCEGDKLCVELSNENVNAVDVVVLVGLFSKDIDPEYEAVSLRRPASLDNNSSLT